MPKEDGASLPCHSAASAMQEASRCIEPDVHSRTAKLVPIACFHDSARATARRMGRPASSCDVCLRGPLLHRIQ